MNRSTLILRASVLDQFAGDPDWLPHPVRLIGLAISRGEAAVRWPEQSPVAELLSGAALTLCIVGSAYCIARGLIDTAYRRSAVLGNAVEVVLGWTCLAAQNLQKEAASVIAALDASNLRLARSRLSRIVGRDTDALSSEEISRAVIETLAESTCDGIVSPLFYMALGGVPLAMAYKAVNTLDSMIGHADPRYFYFGKLAARLDDATNYLPARLTAGLIVGASIFLTAADPHAAWRTWLRDGDKHKSPNAGQPESAIAGALRVRLGGDNTYAGELVSAFQLGAEFPAPDPADATRAAKLIRAVTILGVACGIFIAALATSRGRQATE